jgi:hypothetical protein
MTYHSVKYFFVKKILPQGNGDEQGMNKLIDGYRAIC